MYIRIVDSFLFRKFNGINPLPYAYWRVRGQRIKFMRRRFTVVGGTKQWPLFEQTFKHHPAIIYYTFTNISLTFINDTYICCHSICR